MKVTIASVPISLTLDDEMQSKVRKLCEQYKVFVGARQPQKREPEKANGLIHALAGTNPDLKISKKQRDRLWAIGKSELKLTDEKIKAAYKHFGFGSSDDITPDKYDQIIQYMHEQASPNQPTQDLYPAHNNLVKQVRKITNHSPDWIVAQCKAYGYSQLGDMPSDQIGKLLAEMGADYAYGNGSIRNRDGAYMSFQGAIAFAQSSGQPILDAALAWLARHQHSNLRA